MKVVHLICAARPNFMKVAPLYHALKNTDWCEPVLVWVKQHADENMSWGFLNEFGLANVGAIQLPAGGFHDVRPDAVVVAGDVNTSADYAVKAAQLGIPVVHLEAGLRSFDRSMPEEINRVVIDHVSSLLLTPSEDARINLLEERMNSVLVGNIMIDAFKMMHEKIGKSMRFNPKGPYAVVTLHRPSNVDKYATLADLVDEIVETARVLPVVFPMHPRTYKSLVHHHVFNTLRMSKVEIVAPMGYVEFMALVKGATIVITDSGGVQEETSYLGVPCATVRENTERPITCTLGTNVLISPDEIVESARYALAGDWQKGKPIPLWDGKTAERCVAALQRFLS